jgi:ubiquitin carboxyl-terminal hydrolase 14
VKFSFELDALDLVTDDLKAKLSPLNRKLKEIEKERDERRKVRKRTKAKAIEDAAVAAVTSNAATSSTSAAATSTATAVSTKDGDVEMKDETVVTPAVLEDEKVIRQRETKALEELVNPDLKSEVGASLHGLYELVGEYA